MVLCFSENKDLLIQLAERLSVKIPGTIFIVETVSETRHELKTARVLV